MFTQRDFRPLSGIRGDSKGRHGLSHVQIPVIVPDFQKFTSLPIAFRILAFLVGELHHGDTSANPPPPQERQYARAYRENNVELRQKLVVAAKSFLEQE